MLKKLRGKGFIFSKSGINDSGINDIQKDFFFLIARFTYKFI